jgi:hypothetical protein
LGAHTHAWSLQREGPASGVAQDLAGCGDAASPPFTNLTPVQYLMAGSRGVTFQDIGRMETTTRFLAMAAWAVRHREAPAVRLRARWWRLWCDGAPQFGGAEQSCGWWNVYAVGVALWFILLPPPHELPSQSSLDCIIPTRSLVGCTSREPSAGVGLGDLNQSHSSGPNPVRPGASCDWLMGARLQAITSLAGTAGLCSQCCRLRGG